MAIQLPADFLTMIGGILPAAPAAESASLQEFVDYCQRPLRRSIRVNTLKISVEDFVAQIAAYGWRLTPVPWCAQGFWVERDDEARLPLGSAAEHLSGLFYIQEASSMLPVTALFADNPQLAEGCVLDMAAAPGSKTTQIAAAMGNHGLLLANEFSASRIKVLCANISRCGVSNVALSHLDGRLFGQMLPESVDAILLDAPCSGEGMIRKDTDALRSWSLAAVQAMAATQRQLIDSAFHALRVGGRLVYSTCTLNQYENQQVCQYLLERYAGAVDIVPLNQLFTQAGRALTPEGFLHVFPQWFDSEGFFVACLRKTASVLPACNMNAVNNINAANNGKASRKKPNDRKQQAGKSTDRQQGGDKKRPKITHRGQFPFTPLTAPRAGEIQQAAARLGLHWSEERQLWGRDDEIWLFPAQIQHVIGKIRFARIGLKLAYQHNKGYRWQHEAIIALAGQQNPQTFALDAGEAQSWYQGRDIYPGTLPIQDEVIVSFQGQPLGIAKKIAGRLKNYYPRELVRNGKLFADADNFTGMKDDDENDT